MNHAVGISTRARGLADMLTTEMSPIIAAAQPGDTIVVRHAGGRPTTYKVRSVGGRKARELKLEGRRGSMRVLVNGGDQIWIREASARASDGAAHRRVLDLRAITCAAPANVSEATLADRPRPTSQILRDMAIRHAGLPPGHYGIELDPRGFQAHVAFVPIGEPQASAWVAVCRCWQHHSEQAQSLADGRWDCIVKHAQAEARVLDRLPNGYTIEPGDPGFHRAEHDDSGWVGAVRESESEAVVDAWTHAHEQLLGTLSKHRTTAIDRDVARGDASRCRRALQQILEIAKGNAPSGKELPSGKMPEQVVADVGHALRVESKGTRPTATRIGDIEVKLEQIDADPDRVLSGFIPKLQAMADRRTQPYEKDPTP